ncbi:MAG: hypothetical protein RCG15_01920 [Candidatus Rickettsia vulgarisii]
MIYKVFDPSCPWGPVSSVYILSLNDKNDGETEKDTKLVGEQQV